MVPSERTWVLQSADKARNENEAHNLPIEYLNSINLSSMPPHRLYLKVGTPVMLLRNLDPSNGHVNGARYYILKITNKIVYAKLATGIHKGNDILIPRILFHPEDKTIPFEMERKQFPIRPCFAITSNKSQGQTLEKVGIYLKNHFFAHGQLYVAMSRIGHPSKLSLYNPNLKKEYTRNVVYKEILS